MSIDQIEILAKEKGEIFPKKDFSIGCLCYRLGLSIDDIPNECDKKEAEKGFCAQAADFYLD